MNKVFAQTNLGPIQGEGLGPFGNISFGAGGGALALEKFTVIISSIVGIMTIAAGIWFLFQFLTGGFYWITAGGDKTKLETARDRILNAFVGLILVIAGWSILALAGQFLGFDILIRDPGTIMQNLGIQ